MPPLTIPVDTVRHALARHGGNRTRAADDIGVSSNTLRKFVQRYDLTAEADNAALSANRPGPRVKASDEAMAIERDRLLLALAQGNAAQAAKSLEMTVATLYRRRREFDITREEIAAMRLSTRSTTGSASDPAS